MITLLSRGETSEELLKGNDKNVTSKAEGLRPKTLVYITVKKQCDNKGAVSKQIFEVPFVLLDLYSAVGNIALFTSLH